MNYNFVELLHDSHMRSLSISIVTFNSDLGQLRTTLTSLRSAIQHAQESGEISNANTRIVDNANQYQQIETLAAEILDQSHEYEVIQSPKNLGFGVAHNRAIFADSFDLHLVLNPDLQFDSETLIQHLSLMKDGVVATTPIGQDENGNPTYLQKSYPSLLVLFLRGLGQNSNSLPTGPNYRYTHPQSGEPILASGCFMLINKAQLKAIGGFDQRFFLYFEDYDLSLRLQEFGGIEVCSHPVTHFGGQASRKGLKHIYLFARSALKFFNRHGWKLL